MEPTEMNESRDLPPTANGEQLTSLLGKNVADKTAKKKSEYLEKEITYPKSVAFIVGNEFCERFTFYGMKAILSLYLHQILNYDRNTSTIIYHIFIMVSYFFPLFGAILADSFIGKFKTIFYLSIIYALGNALLAFASTPYFGLPMRSFSLLGLLLIAIGAGGIKPCVSAFGGDQFKLPAQEQQLQQFFSLFYFSINAGSLIATYLTPTLRYDVHCFHTDSCYPLAFGVPAIIMLIATAVFVFGKRFYVIKKPEGNIVVDVMKCIYRALVNKASGKCDRRAHWLDYADDKFDRALIEDIKSVLRVLLLFIPLPFFWALFDQQGSRWTFQATQMNGSLGWLGTIKPEQMQIVNPFLVLSMIPLFEGIIYPIFNKMNALNKPLQKMVVGGMLISVSFVISGVIELKLEDSYAVLPGKGEGQIRVFNGLNCPVNLHSYNSSLLDARIDSLKALQLQHFPVINSLNYDVNIEISCNKSSQVLRRRIRAEESVSLSYLIVEKNESNNNFYPVPGHDRVQKSKNSNPIVRILYSVSESTELTLSNAEITETLLLESDNISIPVKELSGESPNFKVYVAGKLLEEITLNAGGVYSLLLVETNGHYKLRLITITEANNVHILWQIPQYVIVTAAEIMFSITGLQFAFTQAPEAMKSVLTAAWLLTTSLGNCIVILIARIGLESRANEFFLFAGLMVFVMGLFTLLAVRYTYVNINSSKQHLVTSKLDVDNKNTMNGSES
ncbi:hypothetical protein LSTR_LSTR002052 [Laodelphax striatellus]|uniref:Oligopeptide transporter 1 n=1 Tax=Laodelphax striatellus TaxID=195883 RepID=A0A482XQD9_LAOST|nr:hypothetical protein LSTR_LSTR002052 [Laodelphax striatellus]